jgi:spermidine synthase
MAKLKVSSRIVKSGKARWFSEAAIPLRRPGTTQLSLLIERLVHRERSPYQDILIFSIPSYLCGDYCFIAASKARDLAAPDFKSIGRRFAVLDRKRRFRYYSPDMHRAACTLPRVWRL